MDELTKVREEPRDDAVLRPPADLDPFAMLISLGLSVNGVLTEFCKVDKSNTLVKSCRISDDLHVFLQPRMGMEGRLCGLQIVDRVVE